jgi:hypothetical protein
MAQILIKGKLLNKIVKTNEHMSFFIYQFQITNNDDLLSIINIHSRKEKNINKDEEIELPIIVSVSNNDLFFEFL